jgi:hypothetical protein
MRRAKKREDARPMRHAKTRDDAARREAPSEWVVERTQTGVRLEKRLVKVLKALAEYYDISLGDLLEGIVLHAFDGRCPFDRAAIGRIGDLKRFYGLELDWRASHRLREAGETTQ